MCRDSGCWVCVLDQFRELGCGAVGDLGRFWLSWVGVGDGGVIFGFHGVLDYPFCSVGKISELPFDRFRWDGMCAARVALGFVDGIDF